MKGLTIFRSRSVTTRLIETSIEITGFIQNRKVSQVKGN